MFSPPWTPLPFCSLLNCPNAGEVTYNGRVVCRYHMEQLTRPSSTSPLSLPSSPAKNVCAFPKCSKPGVVPHSRDLFCRRHLTPLLVLDAHIAGLTLPPRSRINKGGRVVELCHVGNCVRNGNKFVNDLLVCKDHALLLVQKEKFVDKKNSKDYTLLSSESVSRTEVCNFVECSNTDVSEKYHGVFCCDHLPVIDDIRTRIMMAKCHGDELEQISLRYNEIYMRKFLDKRHVEYYNELVAKHGFVAPLVHVMKGEHPNGLSRSEQGKIVQSVVFHELAN